MKRNEQIKIAVGIVVFFGLIALYVMEFPIINNTLQAGILILYSFVVLCVIFAAVYYFLQRDIKKIFERFMILMGGLLVAGILAPLLGSLSNRLAGNLQPDQMKFKLIEISARSEQAFGLIDSTDIKTDGYRVSLLTDHGTESLYLENLNRVAVTEDSIELPVYSGAWGFDYVKKENK